MAAPNKFAFRFLQYKLFSNSSFFLVDVDKILADAAKYHQELENYKAQLEKEKKEELAAESGGGESAPPLPVPTTSGNEEPHSPTTSGDEGGHASPAGDPSFPPVGGQGSGNERTFLTEAKENIDKLMEKHGEVEDKMIDRVEAGYDLLDPKKASEISSKYSGRRQNIMQNSNDRADALEAEFSDPLKPVAYFSKKVELENSGFKKVTEALWKEEEEIHKELKKGEYYKNNKEQYEKERLEWKEKHLENVKECRQDKQDVKKMIESNLERPSEMAEDLVNETGPDYTGGDD